VSAAGTSVTAESTTEVSEANESDCGVSVVGAEHAAINVAIAARIRIGFFIFFVLFCFIYIILKN
jgi:hypothetical protein